MPTVEFTVKVPSEILEEIDRRDQSRNNFVVEAVRHELDRRRRNDLRRSLENPHSESVILAGEGFESWVRSLPAESAESLVDVSVGIPVQWIPGEGWVERNE